MHCGRERATVPAMHYLTISEYARLAGISRQAVQGQIERKTLKLVTRKVSVKRIPVADIEAIRVKGK